MDECESKPEINQTVGDEYELGIECWNCGYKWIIFRHVAREDGSAKCPQCGMWNKRALQQALADTEIIEGYLNSPQFKKEYARIEKTPNTRKWLIFRSVKSNEKVAMEHTHYGEKALEIAGIEYEVTETKP